MSASLVVSGLVVRYGPVPAVDGVDFQLEKGRIATIVGSNGAGKSTIMKALAGLVKPHAGRVQLFGDDVTGQEPDALVRRGLSLVPEGRRLFTAMSVGDNLQAGAYSRSDKAAIAADLDRVLTHFPALRDRLKAQAGSLSGGQQQMVAVARALSGDTRVLLLDEPFEGLSPAVTEELFEAFHLLRKDISIIIVDHHLDLALALSDRTIALERGEVTHVGPSKALRDDLELRRKVLWL